MGQAEVRGEFPPMVPPRDEEGYCKSFKLEEKEELLQFFNEFGFVVIDGILEKDECADTVDEIWKGIEGMSERVKRDDPSTWNSGWPRGAHVGLLGSFEAIGPKAWRNRQNPRLYDAFSTVMGRKDLWVSVDRYGMMRPTRNVKFPKKKIQNESDSQEKTEEETTKETTEDGECLMDKPEWKTEESWVHWDLNPWKYTDTEVYVKGVRKMTGYKFDNFISENNDTPAQQGVLKLQGLIALADAREEDGGFCTVPGIWRHLKEWAQYNAAEHSKKFIYSRTFVPVPQGDPLSKQLVKIPMRAGSLVIWRGEQAHCNYPNDSDKFRVCQYVKMFDAHPDGDFVDERTETLRKLIPKDFEISELGSKLFGLKRWDS